MNLWSNRRSDLKFNLSWKPSWKYNTERDYKYKRSSYVQSCIFYSFNFSLFRDICYFMIRKIWSSGTGQRGVYAIRLFEEPLFRSRLDMLAHSIRSSNTLSLASGKPTGTLGLVFRVRCSSSYIFFMKISIITLLQSVSVLNNND